MPVPENQYGEFFMGDCYIVLYAYLEGSREHYILYYWIVSKHAPRGNINAIATYVTVN